MKSHEEAMEIFNKFGIQTELVEPTVYKVINDTQEFNIDALESELGECILLISEKIRYEKMPEGYSVIHARIYYILLDPKAGLTLKYNDISSQTNDTMIKSFRYNPNYVESIDTIYSLEELGIKQ